MIIWITHQDVQKNRIEFAGKTKETVKPSKEPIELLLLIIEATSRERPKSAPYLRLKNSKRTSKCQKTLFPNFEEVISELRKRYIRNTKKLQ